jgi:hypothetical protein
LIVFFTAGIEKILLKSSRTVEFTFEFVHFLYL